MKKRLIIPIVLVVLVVGAAGAYEYLTAPPGVVSTSMTTGKITGIDSSAIPKGANGQTTGATYLSIRVTSTNATISQLITCVQFPYYVGMQVRVADQKLTNGEHQYLPDVACKGQVSPFVSYTRSAASTSST